MIDPVLSRIWRKREVTDSIPVDFVIEMEKNTEANTRERGMCAFGGNVIAGEGLFCLRESLGCQELFDREVGKLDDLGASDIDDGNKARTRG
jgi:hypothetical protein